MFRFTWNPDPVLVGFSLPFFYAMLGLGVLGALMAFFSNRSGDKGGFQFALVLTVGAIVAGLVWRDWTPWVGLRYYSLLFVVVFLGGYYLLNWQVRRGGGGEEAAGDFIVYGVLGVLVGARLGHVLFYDFEKALEDPAWVIRIWDGGLASHGATIGLIIAMYLFTKARRVPFLEGSDRFSFSAAFGAAMVRLGNFMNSEIVGRETGADWGTWFKRTCVERIDGDRECWGYDEVETLRHPSQLYELALGLLVLLGLWIADRAWGKEKRPRGAMISLFFVLYFSGRFAVEFFKEYQVPALEEAGFLTMGQYLSIPAVVLGAYGLWWSFKRRLPVGWEADRSQDDDEEEEEDEPRRVRLRDPDVDAVFGEGRRRARQRASSRRRRAGRSATASSEAGDSRVADEDKLDRDDDELDREDDELDRDDDEVDREDEKSVGRDRDEARAEDEQAAAAIEDESQPDEPSAAPPAQRTRRRRRR